MRGVVRRESAPHDAAHVPPPSHTAPNEWVPRGVAPWWGVQGGNAPLAFFPNRTDAGHTSTRVPLRAGQAAAVPGRPRSVTVVRVKLLIVPCSARKCSSTEASK